MKNLLFLTATLILFFSCTDSTPSVNGTDPAVTTTLSVPSTLSIGKSGPSYIKIDSNTAWTVYVNNSGSTGRITGLDISPLSGTGDGTLRVSYGSISTTYYDAQNATVVVYYYSKGIKQSKSISIIRKAVTQ